MQKVLSIVAAIVLPACGAPRVGPMVDAGTPIEPTFSAINENVFQVSCVGSQCHGDPPKGPMSLAPGLGYKELVEAPAIQAKDYLRVKPGSPEASYLVAKLRGTGLSMGGTPTRMPIGKPPLPPEQIEAIEEWIAKGAPND